jgi:hypothetical protein
MRTFDRRLAHVEAQVNALFPEPVQTPEEAAADQAAGLAILTRWLERLTDSMAEAHYYLLQAWIDDYGKRCQHDPCPLPPGLSDHLFKLWAWKGDETRPIALPAEVVEVYLAGDAHQRLNTRPYYDCEQCGYPVPTVFFMTQHGWCPFERCPIPGCNGAVGYHAYDIAHQANGWHNLVPYSQRDTRPPHRW